MNATQTEAKSFISLEELHRISCPLCGDRMQRMKAFQGTDEQFAWFECIRKNCPGWIVQAPGMFPADAEQVQV